MYPSHCLGWILTIYQRNSKNICISYIASMYTTFYIHQSPKSLILWMYLRTSCALNGCYGSSIKKQQHTQLVWIIFLCLFLTCNIYIYYILYILCICCFMLLQWANSQQLIPVWCPAVVLVSDTHPSTGRYSNVDFKS